MADDTPTPPVRPRPEEVAGGLPGLSQFPSSLTSVRTLLLSAGSGASLLGILVWLFIRDIAGAGLLVLAIGAVLLIAYVAVSWREVGRGLFGRRGRYGLNTVIIVAAFLALAVAGNYLLFWLINRPEPMGWLRVDTTATKESLLSDQALVILNNLTEPIRANAFFVTNTTRGAAAWQNTEDLLDEFRRRSNGKFDFKLIDPELEPNVAAQFGVTSQPAIALEALDSRRTQVIQGGNPLEGSKVFGEGDISSGLLVVSQIRQKGVVFLTGHGERDITDLSDNGKGYGRAVQALARDNYGVAAATAQELADLLAQDDPSVMPAVVVVAGPQSDLLPGEETVLTEFLARGGSALFLLEPETSQTWRDLLGLYGITLGTNEVVDTSSYVRPNPGFLQLMRSNGQFPTDNQITAPIDVVYVPGATFIGRTVDEATVPLADDGTPYVKQSLLAVTTLRSWEETGKDVKFDIDQDTPGPLPVAVAVSAISELDHTPKRKDGKWVERNLVVIADSDFASNAFFSSAKNGDLLANSVNWLARDFELISVRPKTQVFRELVLTSRERQFVRWTGWLLMPVLVGSGGVFTWWRRR